MDGISLNKEYNKIINLTKFNVNFSKYVDSCDLLKQSPDYILEKLDNFCSYNYQKLALAGTFSPPHRALSYEEEIADVDRINNSGANMVLVSMGCPRQERWMAGMKGKIDAVMIGVGGAFSLLDGEEKQAPIWMQRNGLEWFYRLIQDPKRQIKRYWITNIEFKRLVFIEKYKTIR
jgi:N-acetylglucosaminyldiphosphoundecaprenol N-acetyl-beta-D-mannosaminyltransferase